jgi:hypothetical protein
MRWRSTVLLCCLAGFVTAAPAPSPRRERPASEEYTWSQPVNGLRARLVAPKKRYAMGDTVRLVLEVQNVTDRPVELGEPRLGLPSWILPPDEERYGWSVTGEQVDRREGQLEERKRRLIRDQGSLVLVTLRAGGTYRIHLDIHTGSSEPKERTKRGEDERADLFFPDATEPGTYLFRVRYDGNRGDDVERRPVLSPPVIVELTR